MEKLDSAAQLGESHYEFVRNGASAKTVYVLDKEQWKSDHGQQNRKKPITNVGILPR